ncbi:MAG TPA: asparagine synthase (glutamine-hydrolyzing), partial [Woeseiaceae bacterium]|nr:asparagine synthase (glutamine-hydrolyzing) [Woeseiaceae bacterium]
MCGFCGIYAPADPDAIDRELVLQMTRLMAERGPDAEGLYFAGPIALGHRRLTIIDLSAGEQPVFNEDRSVLVVFNGEIFNFQELRKDLERRGHAFRTNTDTEVIVHAYEEYGASCVDHFRGMFAFAVFDKRDGKIFLARDRMGIKPLYYATAGGRLLFASEVKPLLLALGESARVDAGAVDFFVTTGFVPGDTTVFGGIHKLLPGCYLEWVNGAPRTTRYWDLPDAGVLQIGFDEAQERLAELVRESVSLRMISDVPIGAFLSGGLDSSVVVANMCSLGSQRVKTFSIGYEDSPQDNELPFARSVARHLGTDHTEHVLRSGDFLSNIEAFVLRAEEPIVEAAGIALHLLAERARKDVTVVLSGEGGDEILAGYPIYRTMSVLGRSAGLRRLTGAAWLARFLARHAKSEKVVKYLDWLGRDVGASYLSVPNDVTHSLRGRMYRPEFAASVGDVVAEHFGALFAHLSSASDLRRMAYVDFKSWLPDDLLIKADKMTMAASVELRVPLLDHKLVEFCMSLPDEYRLSGRSGKHLLKTTAERWLPKDIIYRKKQGFPTPIARWFRSELYGSVRDLLLSRRALERGYFQEGYVRSVLERHRSGQENLSRRILTMVILEVWHRTFVDGVCGPVASA